MTPTATHTIDPVSVAMFIALLASALAVGMLLLWRWERTSHGFGFWAAAQAMFALGMILLLARIVVPLWMSILFGNVAILMALVLVRAGILRFRDLPLRIGTDVAVSVTTVAVVLAQWAYGLDTDARIAVGNLAYLFLSIRCFTALSRPAPGVSLLFRSLQAVMLVIALLVGLRSAFSAFASVPSASLFDGSWAQTLVYISLGITSVLLPFLLMLLNSLRNLDRLRAAQAEAEAAASTDYLTGLANRRRLFRRLRQLPGDTPLSVVLLDLDDFKAVNDQCGHSTGDRVLAQLGRLLLQMTVADEIAVRLGGEEFGIVSTGSAHERARQLAEMVRARVERELGVKAGLDRRQTCSIGVSHGRADNTDAALARADIALYEAKRRGKNRVVDHREITAKAARTDADYEPVVAHRRQSR
ncbi:MAG TPA: GGDEF domain-containing protein [Wenzhouxiangellaceae bacterium]|nr:GGDEF domain-containing protein [Wenzhouxiangellaceae bacterium]